MQYVFDKSTLFGMSRPLNILYRIPLCAVKTIQHVCHKAALKTFWYKIIFNSLHAHNSESFKQEKNSSIERNKNG